MTTRTRQWALAVVSTSGMVVSLDSSIVNVALPTLVRDLHASISELQWIVDSYIVVMAGLLMVGGSLADRFGRALVLRVGLVIFGVASLAAAFSASATALVICRAAMGMGAALIFPASVAVVSNMFTDTRERGRALGVWAAFAGFGVALGPVVGGILLTHFWWGSMFLVNVPIVAVAVVVGWWAIPESRNPEVSRFDPVGVAFSVLAVSALLWATIQAPTNGWGSVSTLTSFAVAFALLGCFVFWELHCTHPMLELGLFRNPQFSTANATAGISNMAYSGTLFLLTQLLQFVFGYSPLSAGLRMAPMAAMLVVAGLIGPRLAERIGTKHAVALGLGIFAVGLVVLAIATEDAGFGWILASTLAIGVGLGLTVAPTTNAVVGAVPRWKAGLASGTQTTMRTAGSAVGIALIGSVLVSGYQSAIATRAHGIALSNADLATARTSVGAALEVAHDLGGATGRALGDAARGAFVDGMRLGIAVGAALLVLAAILALRYLPARAGDVDGDQTAESIPQFEVFAD